MDSPTSRIEHKVTWIVVSIAITGLGLIGYRVLADDMQERIPISVGAKTFYAEVAKTNDERSQGLSGTAKLADSHGLLMVFDEDERWKIWMKDMNYPIDIVWVSKDKRVVDKVQGAQPDSYPDKEFVPHSVARYVLELPEGSIKQYSINNGMTLRFDDHGLVVL